MALILPEWGYRASVCFFVFLLSVHTATGMSGWGGCLEGQNVFAAVRENSPPGEVIAELMATDGVRWSLKGKDADWFFLDEGLIRLSTSAEKVLDREAQGPILSAELLCYEEDTLQAVFRIMVEIRNENDNFPVFAEDTVRSHTLSELTPVNSVVFTVRATDADKNNIVYSIDQTSPDAGYFRIDLPNSGKVILSKPLDYETKTMLSVTIHASEMNTAERFNTSTNITITVLDGDDHYPQFLPCMLLYQDETRRICTSPVYTVNITEGEEDIVLDFSPGPIHAVDGDTGLSSPVSYAILSGDDDRRFLMDRETGQMKVIQGVLDRLKTPSLRLQVMAYQDDDPRKYSVATVLVRVLAVNRFYPEFDVAEYKGFVTAGKSLVSLVNTYGSKALMLHVKDQDFLYGFNPMIHFTFSPTSNHTDIYRITQEGLLIIRTSQLIAKQKHVLEVMAVDQESGDATSATVVVEVLSEGQSIPLGPPGDRMTGCAVGQALFLSTVFMSALGCFLSMAVWLRRKLKGPRGPLGRDCVAQGKHPNVSLRWFQQSSYHNAMPHQEEGPCSNDDKGTYNPSFSLTVEPDNYARRDVLPSRGTPSPRATAAPDTSLIPTETVRSPVNLDRNVSTPAKSSSSSPTFHPATVDTSPKCMSQGAAPTKGSPGSPTDTSPDPTEALPTTISDSPTTHDTTNTCPDSQNTQTATNADPADPVNGPSSHSTILRSSTQIASAEIDKPFYKPCVMTPLPKQMGTTQLNPDDAPLKAKLVHIHMPPFDSPLATPARTSIPLSTEVDEPSTSLDETDRSDHPEAAADADSPSQGRRCLTNSGKARNFHGALDVDDDGFLGNEDAGKNSESEGELEPDEEELLSVLARCNPIFFTFSK